MFKEQASDEVSFSTSLVEECISINSDKEMFSPAAWLKVKRMLYAPKDHQLWHCSVSTDLK